MGHAWPDGRVRSLLRASYQGYTRLIRGCPDVFSAPAKHDRLHWCAMMLVRCTLMMLVALSAGAQTLIDGRPAVALEGRVAQVAVDLGGGSIIRFQFKDQPLNPLSWTSDEPGQAHPMGHFLCLDR